MRGGGAEANEDGRADGIDLGLDPRAAGGDFPCGGSFVDAAFSAHFEFEVFHGVRHVGGRSVDARFFQRTVKEFSPPGR